MRELIAILRGVTPDEAIRVANAVRENGIAMIEVPLNSPDAFKSITLLADHFKDDTIIGAGTVLRVDEVERLEQTGGQMAVSPNCDPHVIRKTKSLSMLSFPGVLTPTECFQALHAGADGLKFFPSSLLRPEGLKAIKAVLPAQTKTYAVGGAGPDSFLDWFQAGVTGFGIGTALYKPGDSPVQTGQKAGAIVQAYDQALEQMKQAGAQS